MTLCLDTSILIDLERKNPKTLNSIKEQIIFHPKPAKIAFISYFEMLYGIENKNVKNKEKAASFLEEFEVLNTSKETAKILSSLKRKYEKKGLIFSLSDLLIASQAIENNLTLITKDKDFEKIEELQKIVL